ncbi:MAG: hypothetical protein U0359_26085 [Byssovorax sp.]
MSTTRRRRFLDVLRRTAGALDEGGAPQPPAVLDDAALWAAEEQAVRSLGEAGARAEKLAAAVARQRALIDAAAERASVVTAHADGLQPSAGRVAESFERLGVVALNAGLEGARMPEAQGRALLLLSEEIRANVRRGADAAEQLRRAVEEIGAEAADVKQRLDRSRAEVSEVGQESAHLQAAAQQAGRSLDDLVTRLRKASGVDPETARAVAAAGEHARGLLTALSSLGAAAQGAAVSGALRPLIGPLAKLLHEIEDKDEGGEGPG